MSDFVAKEHIYSGDPGRGVIAYAKGQTIAADVVKANNWQDQVVGVNTKEGRQIVAELTGEQVDSGSAATSSNAQKG